MKLLIFVKLRLLKQFLIVYILNNKVVWVIHTYFSILIWRIIHWSPPAFKIYKRIQSLLHAKSFMIRKGLEFESFAILILFWGAVSISSVTTILTFLVEFLTLFLICLLKHLLYLLTILIRDVIIWWLLEVLGVLFWLVSAKIWLIETFCIIVIKNLPHNMILRWWTCFEDVFWQFRGLDLYLSQIKHLSWMIQVIRIFLWRWTIRIFTFIEGTRRSLISCCFHLHYGKIWYSHNAFCGPSLTLIIALNFFYTLHNDEGRWKGTVSFITTSTLWCLGRRVLKILEIIGTIRFWPLRF